MRKSKGCLQRLKILKRIGTLFVITEVAHFSSRLLIHLNAKICSPPWFFPTFKYFLNFFHMSPSPLIFLVSTTAI